MYFLRQMHREATVHENTATEFRVGHDMAFTINIASGLTSMLPYRCCLNGEYPACMILMEWK